MTKYVCEVAKEFSRFPGGRLIKDGPRSGEEFKNDYVLPLLERYEFVTFDLSGSAGYSTGWLDEAFGFLGQRFDEQQIKKRVEFVASDDPEAVKIIWQRIGEARAE